MWNLTIRLFQGLCQGIIVNFLSCSSSIMILQENVIIKSYKMKYLGYKSCVQHTFKQFMGNHTHYTSTKQIWQNINNCLVQMAGIQMLRLLTLSPFMSEIFYVKKVRKKEKIFLVGKMGVRLERWCQVLEIWRRLRQGLCLQRSHCLEEEKHTNIST